MRVLIVAALAGVFVLALALFVARATGIVAIVPLATGILVIALFVVVAARIFGVLRRGMEGSGHDSMGAYLRSTPRSDREAQDAVDLALLGVVLCILGILLPPLVLLGLSPLYYGARKLIRAGMGLGLADAPDGGS